jgi:hypothetical protein
MRIAYPVGFNYWSKIVFWKLFIYKILTCITCLACFKYCNKFLLLIVRNLFGYKILLLVLV